MNAATNQKAIILFKVATKILLGTISLKYMLMISVCQLSLLLIFLMNSSPLNNDLSGVSINNPLALPPVFGLALLSRALDKSSLIKFILI